jgi:hypothetical protein
MLSLVDDDWDDPNNWPCRLPHRALYLSDSEPSRYCILDNEDWEWANRTKWFMSNPNCKLRKHYAVHTFHWAVDGMRKKGLRYLHKEVLLRVCKPPSRFHQVGDHINGDSLDNRRCNLRWATFTENATNRNGWHYRQLNLLRGFAA